MVRYCSVIALILFLSCSKKEICNPIEDKPDVKEVTGIKNKPAFKGVNYESPANIVGPETFHSVVNINANSVSIIPFGFISNSSSAVSFNSSFQWWGEKDEGVIALTQHAKDLHLKVMIKPQVWIGGGSYTGDYEPTSEAEWQNLENSYLTSFTRLYHYSFLFLT
jgi:hypothetical protein